jgi:hypothetical protein
MNGCRYFLSQPVSTRMFDSGHHRKRHGFQA